ncbi:hypothetical protein EE612_060887, partial [Oryza sativa]
AKTLELSTLLCTHLPAAHQAASRAEWETAPGTWFGRRGRCSSWRRSRQGPRGASRPTPIFVLPFLSKSSFCSNRCKLKMAGFGSLAPKTKNIVVAGGLSAFVLGVYYYTMRAVGGTDELQVAIDKFEGMKKKDAGNSSAAGS